MPTLSCCPIAPVVGSTVGVDQPLSGQCALQSHVFHRCLKPLPLQQAADRAILPHRPGGFGHCAPFHRLHPVGGGVATPDLRRLEG